MTRCFDRGRWGKEAYGFNSFYLLSLPRPSAALSVAADIKLKCDGKNKPNKKIYRSESAINRYSLEGRQSWVIEQTLVFLIVRILDFETKKIF